MINNHKEIINFYHKNGFAVIRDCINKKDIKYVREFLKRKKNLEFSNLKKNINVTNQDQFMKKIVSIHKNNRLDKYFSDEQIKVITGHFPLEVRLSEVPLKLINLKIRKLFEKILITKNIYLHWPVCSRFVIPQNKFAMVPAHIDKDYNQHMQNFFTCWIPLVKISEKCGGIRFFQSRHISKRSKKNKGLWLEKIDTKNLNSISPKMNLGDLLIFNNQIIHESKTNTSSYTRYSVDMRFFGDMSSSLKHYYDFKTKKVRLN